MNDIKVSYDHYRFKSMPNKADTAMIIDRIPDNIRSISKDGIEAFVKSVSEEGCTFCPATFKNGFYGVEEFIQSQLSVLDFDTGITPDEVFDRAKRYNLPVLFAYRNFSPKGDNERFRIALLNEIPIPDEEATEIIQSALMTIFPEAHERSKTVSRPCYGGKKLLHFDESVSAIDIESLFRNMTLCLKDRHGATNYKKKVAEFAVENGIRLNDHKLLDISVTEYSTEELSRLNKDQYKNSPKTIILDRSYGENLLTRRYKINLEEESNNDLSTENKNRKIHSEERSYFLKKVISSCQLFDEFVSGKRILNNEELLGLASNLYRIESGTAKVTSTIEKHQYFDGDIEKHNQWKFYMKYFDQTGLQSRHCDLFCPYRDECNHGSDIISTAKSKRRSVVRLANFKEIYYPIEEVEQDVAQTIQKAINAQDTKVHIVKAQTAIGKSKTFIDLMKDSPLTWLINAPTNDLKHELLDRAAGEGIEIIESPSLLELGLPDDVMGHINHLYRAGRHRSVIPYLKKLIAEDGRCSTDLIEYLKDLDGFNNSTCNAIATHKKFMYMDVKTLKKYDVIIIDEDIILKGFAPDQCIIPIPELKKALKKAAPGSAVARKIKDAIKAAKTETWITLPGVECEEDDDAISTAIDIASFCKSEHFYYRKATDENNLLEDESSKDCLICLRPADLKEGVKLIIVSATVNKTICEYVFGEDRVNFYECKKARYKGILNQDCSGPFSRGYIDKDRTIFDRIGATTGITDLITFKKYLTALLKLKYHNIAMTFGSTEGKNVLEGKNIDVIGTPHQPDWIYKLFAFTFGLDFDKDEKIKPHQDVIHNGYLFRFTTFKDEVLRNIQFWMIESELEQAVGRARLLRRNCTVNLFSNFPLSQASIMEFEYDNHADDNGTIEGERKEP